VQKPKMELPSIISAAIANKSLTKLIIKPNTTGSIITDKRQDSQKVDTKVDKKIPISPLKI
jgi:hypothetical protein